MTSEIAIADVEIFVLRAPAVPPVQTSFGVMHTRPALLVRVRDKSGCHGWGEVWCNFPSVGAEHRARMILEYVKPIVISQAWRDPRQCYDALSSRFEILALQSGEPGTLHQIAAGVDMAIWDMAARRAGLPLWRFIDGSAGEELPRIAVYASGLNPQYPERLAAEKWAEGHRAFKLKVGFGQSVDEHNLRALRATLGEDAALMADANQAWSLDQAVDSGRRFERFGLLWLEEPIRADSPEDSWATLADAQPIALAAGENFSGISQFDRFIKRGALSIIQPDVGKWGGFTGCVAVARNANVHGRWVCPHWLGGGVGLMAAMHLKAAVGGPGYVEIDANPNPLRERLLPPDFVVRDGYISLTDNAGLGFEPDIEACAEFMVDFVGASV
ncbi:mandelate racemase/muconate lactonizing enzyme family protein [Pusillimonas sp.]|uniref:mandelate racemase/muconate lactonizing enzyme family protein n=1 Tax=Pusillimonas sp. TaxID=3040095 RepID=UPI0037CAEF3E